MKGKVVDKILVDLLPMAVANKFSEDSRRRLMCGKRVNSVSSSLMKSSILHDIFFKVERLKSW